MFFNSFHNFLHGCVVILLLDLFICTLYFGDLLQIAFKEVHEEIWRCVSMLLILYSDLSVTFYTGNTAFWRSRHARVLVQLPASAWFKTQVLPL